MSKNKGLSSFDNLQLTQQQYENLGNSIIEQQSRELSTQLQVFQNALLNYSKDHSKEIIENPKFRSEFSKICQSFGLDPILSSSSSSTLNVKNDEFYYQLCIKIIEICRMTKDINGGIILINELLKILNAKDELSNSGETESKDVIIAIDKLKILGDEIKIISIGSKKYLKSIPYDLNNDTNTILDICNIIGGYINISILKANFNWDLIRCKSVLNDMMSNGLLWIDENDDEINYWIPSWINEI